MFQTDNSALVIKEYLESNHAFCCRGILSQINDVVAAVVIHKVKRQMSPWPTTLTWMQSKYSCPDSTLSQCHSITAQWQRWILFLIYFYLSFVLSRLLHTTKESQQTYFVLRSLFSRFHVTIANDKKTREVKGTAINIPISRSSGSQTMY